MFNISSNTWINRQDYNLVNVFLFFSTAASRETEICVLNKQMENSKKKYRFIEKLK